jgi:peptidoglycan/LPS O-acetylase OafA/YrhL
MLINIQFLRFVAAMLVVLYHTAGQVPANGHALHGLFWLGQATGFAGVDIFFVISGFIMAYTTSGEAGRVASLDFARRRVARIFSGYWPFYALALAVFWFTRPQHVAESDLLKSFFLWPQPLNRVLLEITWTLSYELYFYLLFALLVLIVPQRRRLALCTAVTAVILLASVYRHFVTASFSGDKLYLMPFATDFLASPFLLEFFAGTLLAYWLARRRSGPSLAYLVAGSLVFLAGGAVNHWLFQGNIEQGFHVVPRVLWFGAASVLIVAGLVRLEARDLRAPESFSMSTGGASYAIYLSHIPLLVLVQALGLPALLQGRPFGMVALAYLLVMTLILALSVAHYQWLERPLHRLFKRALGVRRGPFRSGAKGPG